MDTLNYYYMALMAAAIAALWIWFKQRSDVCEKDRKQLWQAMGKLTGIAYSVRSCPVHACQLREQAIEALDGPEEEKDPEEVKQRTLKELGINDNMRYHSHPQA